MMMKLKNRILGILLLFILLPLSIFGGFSIYQTNRKIDDMTECNLARVRIRELILRISVRTGSPKWRWLLIML